LNITAQLWHLDAGLRGGRCPSHLYGIAVFIVGVFLIRDEETIRIYRLGIVVTVLLGFVLATVVVFGIGKELGSAT
jgi:hypothetical protein